MGRQTALVATLEDEQKLLMYLRENFDVIFLESFAPTVEGLWKSAFEPEFRGHHTYSLWNRAFPWTPEYKQVGIHAYDPAAIGWYYVANSSFAPVIEFARSRWDPFQPGRIYWAKTFPAPDGPSYDVEAFARWYNTLVGGIRKCGRKPAKGAYEPYYLPDAWEKRGALR